MWDRSKRPAWLRTAWCSAVSLRYRSGISHPANSVIEAPSCSCTACSGVCRGFAASGVVIRGSPGAAGRVAGAGGRAPGGTQPTGRAAAPLTQVKRARSAYRLTRTQSPGAGTDAFLMAFPFPLNPTSGPGGPAARPGGQFRATGAPLPPEC